MTAFDVYKKYLPKLEKAFGSEWKICCPFHNEVTPSFYINERNGYFHCWGCGKAGGLKTFLFLLGVTETEIIREESKPVEIKILQQISPKLVKQFHTNLFHESNKLIYLQRERRISLFLIKKHLIGYDTASDRYSIPIKSLNGTFANIKLHNSALIPKSIYYKHGKFKLFPVSSLLKSNIVICEGEFDCLALLSLGINAITSTSGANAWNSKWSTLFFQKNVKILYDSDRAGKEGALMIKEQLESIANIEIIKFNSFHETVVNTKLGRSVTSKIDITDFINAGMNIFNLLRIRKNI